MIGSNSGTDNPAPGKRETVPHAMPNAAPRPCTHAGCGALVRDGSGRCAKHPREAWAKPVQATKRITGRKLQAMRAQMFASQPLCVQCKAQGQVRLATQRDHITPLAEGGSDSADNVQPLCLACHDTKSNAERLRGRARHRPA